MSKKLIKISLSESGIGKAIEELEAYKKDIERKTNLLRELIAKRLREETDFGFKASIIDVLKEGDSRKPSVDVRLEKKNNITVVIASGEDAVFVEFGAGITFNTEAGSSPHPKGQKLGMTIGDYGYKLGRLRSWRFGDNKETYGTPAQMPMANAVMVVIEEFPELAREVFG